MFWLYILIVTGLIIYNLYEVDKTDNKNGDYYIKAPRDKNGNVKRRTGGADNCNKKVSA